MRPGPNLYKVYELTILQLVGVLKRAVSCCSYELELLHITPCSAIVAAKSIQYQAKAPWKCIPISTEPFDISWRHSFTFCRLALGTVRINVSRGGPPLCAGRGLCDRWTLCIQQVSFFHLKCKFCRKTQVHSEIMANFPPHCFHHLLCGRSAQHSLSVTRPIKKNCHSFSQEVQRKIYRLLLTSLKWKSP